MRPGSLSAIALLALASPPATARKAPAAPTTSRYEPKRTAWGDPDFRATWTLDRLSEAGIPLERPKEQGTRAWLNDEEFAKRLEDARKSDGSYTEDVDAHGTVGLASWVRATPFARRASLIVDPANGRLPPMTPRGKALFSAGRNSWVTGQPIDWVADLDSYDRCVTRGLSSVILPWPNNNGVRVFQAPGYIALQLEVLGTRIIPIGHGEPWPRAVRAWAGRSLGHWEGQTLVIETDGIVAGDSADGDVAKHSASPITGRGNGVVPMSEQAHTVERLTMAGPNSLTYRVTYTDPEIYTAPWTAEVEWTRDDNYRLYEYACHEGNAVRDWITASRAERRKGAEPRTTSCRVLAHAKSSRSGTVWRFGGLSSRQARGGSHAHFDNLGSRPDLRSGGLRLISNGCPGGREFRDTDGSGDAVRGDAPDRRRAAGRQRQRHRNR